jgi:hypothetical protein
VDAHHDYVLNLTLLEKVQNLLAVVADRIVRSDLDERRLAGPRIRRLAVAARICRLT